jgi:hypothetical protein
MNRFDRILSESHLPYDMMQNKPVYLKVYNSIVGQPGVRDTFNPCEYFQYGVASGDCESDGHYMCKECRYLTPQGS